MDSDKLISCYIDKINKEIFSKLNIQECDRIYEEQDVSALTDILKKMHEAFVDVYHTDCLDGDYEWVMLPAVIFSKNNGLLTVGLVTLDLESSGEHWGTTLLTPGGMVDLSDMDQTSAFRDRMMEQWIPYDYYYTPYVTDDIHINKANAPDTVRKMLDACCEQNSEPDDVLETDNEDLEL